MNGSVPVIAPATAAINVIEYACMAPASSASLDDAAQFLETVESDGLRQHEEFAYLNPALAMLKPRDETLRQFELSRQVLLPKPGTFPFGDQQRHYLAVALVRIEQHFIASPQEAHAISTNCNYAKTANGRESAQTVILPKGEAGGLVLVLLGRDRRPLDHVEARRERGAILRRLHRAMVRGESMQHLKAA